MSKKTRFLANEYVFVIEPVEREETEKLIQRGFVLWKREKISDKDSPDYGKYEQMWVRFYEQA